MTELNKLNTANYITEYIRSERLKTPIEPIDEKLLNSNQKLSFDLVFHHFESDTKQALQMKIHGTAWYRQDIYFQSKKDTIHLTASTGKTATYCS